MKRLWTVFAGLLVLGGLILPFVDPFFYLLYCQSVFLVFVIFLAITARQYVLSFPFFILFLAALFLKKGISPAFGVLFLLVFAGRKTLDMSRRVKIIVIAAAVALPLALGFNLLAFRAPGKSVADDARKIAALRSLPYLAQVAEEKNGGRNGVVLYDRRASAAGLNLYNSYYAKGAYLCDMSGNVLHSWFPRETSSDWQYVALCDNGDLLVCVEEAALMRLDWNSRILWKRSLRVHHDIIEADNGDLLTLSRGEIVVTPFYFPVPIVNDYIEILSVDGISRKKISLYDVLKDHISRKAVRGIRHEIIRPRELLWRLMKQKIAHRNILSGNSPFDIFHDNTVSFVERDIPGVCRKGDVMICVCRMNMIGIVDMEKKALTWSWGPGIIEGPHHPTILENGHILVFDNGCKRKFSRVLELDPLRKKIVWEYRALPKENFYSSWGGAAQRLPNGNTLITITNEGKVIEITRDGKIVWEFLNPCEEKTGKRATIYRMTRIAESHRASLLLREARRDG